MANRKVTININTTANTSGAQQATAAMTNLTTATNTATTATSNAGKGASKVGQLAGQAGYQIQDFAVQVGSGTSALTAFAQQAPQLLGAFGPAGAIAGAFVAIGAIAVKVFLSMKDGAMTAEEKAKKLAETLTKITEAAEKAVDENVDFGKRRIEDATTAAKQLAAELNQAAEGQLDLNQAILDSQKELNAAEMILEDLRGKSADKLKLQAEQVAQAAADRKAQLAQDLAAEQQKIVAAELAVKIAQEELAEREAQKAAAYASLAVDYEALKVAREKLETAKKIKKEQTFAALMGETATTPAQREAIGGLDDGSLAKDVADLKGTVISMQKKVEADGQLTSAVIAAERQLTAAEGELTLAVGKVSDAVNKIDLTATTDEATATAEALKERAELLAEEVKKITEGVTASTQGEKNALAVINKNLEDKRIDLTELTSTGQALTQLGPLIREALDGNTQKIGQLITIMGTMKAQSNQIQSRIDDLQRRMSTPSPSK
jgi:chromosome segregation ATPase